MKFVDNSASVDFFPALSCLSAYGETDVHRGMSDPVLYAVVQFECPRDHCPVALVLI